MEAINLTMDRGRSRHSCFLSLLSDDSDYETAWGLAKSMFLGQRQLICAGWLPVTEDGSLYPLGIGFPAEAELKVFLFCLKRYESEVTMTLYPRQLNFWRGNFNDCTGI